MRSPQAASSLKLARARTAPAVAFAFIALGMTSFAAIIALLIAHPAIPLEDLPRPAFLGFAALILCGFVSSLVFAMGYLVSPVMATASLFSARLSVIHLALHTLGLGFLALALVGAGLLDGPGVALHTGLVLILSGAVCFLVNHLATASRQNRWDPEQVTFVFSLFWLGLGLTMALTAVLRGSVPFFGYNSLAWAEAYAPIGLIGFVWLSLLGFALQIFSMFLVSTKRAGALSWIGLVLVNGALLVAGALASLQSSPLLTAIAGAVLLGSLFYLADILRLWMAAKRPLSGALLGAFAGLLLGAGLCAWAAFGLPSPVEETSSGGGDRAVFVLGALGVFAAVSICFLYDLVPFLIWQLRCAPLVGLQTVPTAEALRHRGAAAGLVPCLLLASVYLAAGQWTQTALATQLAGLCLLVASIWFAWALRPSLRAFVFGIPSEQ
jgi:hypothetical protein